MRCLPLMKSDDYLHLFMNDGKSVFSWVVSAPSRIWLSFEIRTHRIDGQAIKKIHSDIEASSTRRKFHWQIFRDEVNVPV